MSNAFLLKPLVPAAISATAGSGQFSPASLLAGGAAGTASWWYDPSDLASMWQNAGRTIAAVVDGPVGVIDDKSGNGRHWIAPSLDARPILRQGGGLSWLELDGMKTGFDTPYAGAAGLDLFVAFRRDPDDTQLLLFSAASGGGNFAIVAQTDNANAGDSYSGGPLYYNNRTMFGTDGRPSRSEILANLPSDKAVLIELRNVDLSTWPRNRLGLYADFEPKGRFYGSINVPVALANASDNRVQLETWLAARAGIAAVPPAAQAFTVTAGATENLLNDYAGVIVEYRGAAQFAITADLGADTSIDTVMMFGVELFAASGALTVDYATAAQGAFTGAYAKDTSGSAYAGSAPMTSGKGVSLWAAPAPVIARYVRLTYAAGGGAALRASRLVIGRRIQLERNFGWGAGFGVRDLGSLDFSARGVLLRRRGAKLRTVSLTFANVRRDEVVATVQPLLEQLGNTDMVALCVDPAADAQRQNRCYFGALVGDLSIVRNNAVRNEAKVNLVSTF